MSVTAAHLLMHVSIALARQASISSGGRMWAGLLLLGSVRFETCERPGCIRSQLEIRKRPGCIMSNQMTGGATACSAAMPCIVQEVQDKGGMQNAIC